MYNRLHTAALALLLSIASPALSNAKDVMHGSLHLSDAWTRATPKTAPTAGGYVKIHNMGDADDVLVSASSPTAKRVEIHKMWITDGVMRMEEIEGGLTIPAGKSVELKPGGLHLMFMRIKKPFVKGEMVPVTLTFKKAGDVTLELPVAKIGAKSKGKGHHHHHHKHSD